MWITLFDDQNDDEYDGALGIQDDENPRVLVDFTIREQPPKKPVAKPVEEPKSNRLDVSK